MVVVLMNAAKDTPTAVRKRFAIGVPVIYAPELAKRCGVYSTPQAVILAKGNKLYYRGNYNLTRYCTDPKTEFAKQALDNLLNHVEQTEFQPLATRAYGCSLPECTL